MGFFGLFKDSTKYCKEGGSKHLYKLVSYTDITANGETKFVSVFKCEYCDKKKIETTKPRYTKKDRDK